MENKDIASVENYWNDNLCGSQFVDKKKFSPEFFNEYRTYRFKKEHHIPEIINATDSSDKDVLEIGLGVGADSTLWAKKSKSFTGIDLTEEAVYATTRHLELLGLKGRIVKGSAETLPFENESFDIVYSHGVLHHTTNIENTFREVNRVLRPNGSFIIMLYTKDSFNYWVRIQFYFRLRLIVEIIKNKFGFSSKNSLWSAHVKNFKQVGLKYLSWKEFPHHCTDGADCTIANIYYPYTIIKALAKYGLKVTRSKKYHFPVLKSLPKLELVLANYLGFFRFYWGVKKGN